VHISLCVHRMNEVYNNDCMTAVMINSCNIFPAKFLIIYRVHLGLKKWGVSVLDGEVCGSFLANELYSTFKVTIFAMHMSAKIIFNLISKLKIVLYYPYMKTYKSTLHSNFYHV